MNYEEIAIIGMAARFSHADNIDELWDNLRVGKDCVTDCPEGRKKDIEDYLKYLNLDKKDIVYRKAAYLKEIDKFDFEFFRIPPNEAKIMDPNQRILLETSLFLLILPVLLHWSQFILHVKVYSQVNVRWRLQAVSTFLRFLFQILLSMQSESLRLTVKQGRLTIPVTV